MQNAENACECVREKMIRIPGKNDTRPESSCPAPPPDAVHSRATLASIADAARKATTHQSGKYRISKKKLNK